MGEKLGKRAILEALREELSIEITHSTRRAQEAAEAATHEENRSEGDKDMRSTEASYVARGQAERVHELERSIATLAAMTIRDFAKGEAIEASALVEIDHEGPKKTRMMYFVVPTGGGVRLHVGGHELSTLATTSPLGSALLGLAEGDEAEVESAQGTKNYTIISVK